jgi:dynein light chain LC8-type
MCHIGCFHCAFLNTSAELVFYQGKEPTQTLELSSAQNKMSKGPDMNINADMTKEMQDDARNFVIAAFESETQEKAIASFVKHEFQRKYKGTWHCIVGKNFGSYVTHETKGYIYLTVGQVAVLLWKSIT